MSSPSYSSIPNTIPLPGGVPDTHRPHTESTTTILVPKENIAFLNPVQQYNRDLSVAVIRAWNEMRKEEMEGRWRRKKENVARGKEERERKRREREVKVKMEKAEGEKSGKEGVMACRCKS
jgi:tRNA (guanine26-N2/guanine27-N2)-dimethyltransferase